jgi:hypothetical protein
MQQPVRNHIKPGFERKITGTFDPEVMFTIQQRVSIPFARKISGTTYQLIVDIDEGSSGGYLEDDI